VVAALAVLAHLMPMEQMAGIPYLAPLQPRVAVVAVDLLLADKAARTVVLAAVVVEIAARQEQATPHLLVPRKGQTAAQVAARQAVAVAVAVLLRRVLPVAHLRRATAEQAQPRQFQAVLLLTLAAAAAAEEVMRRTLLRAVQAAPVVAQTEAKAERHLPQQPTQAAVVVVVGTPEPGLAEAQAALALSSSSTTSALPQSSPSSHRRSGLHQRVR
jgi:hypothetical protein